MKIHVALTFDDGYLSHYNIAKFLYRENIFATFFVVTHLKCFEGRPLLTSYPEMFQAIGDMGHEIGSHSCTHPVLTKLSKQQVEDELKRSKDYLEKLLGKRMRSFAYPHGSYNMDVLLCVAKYYEYARLAGRRFEAKTWNAQLKSHYLIEGIGYKELFKLPVKYLTHHYIKPVLVFHDDPLHIVKLVIRYLRFWKAKFMTLSELFEEI